MPFVGLIAVMIGVSVSLVVSRRDALRSEHRLDSLLSREAVFLGNNLVLVGLAFVVFWGTFFPLISEALTAKKGASARRGSTSYTVPLALVLVLLSGIGPVIAWRRATLAQRPARTSSVRAVRGRDRRRRALRARARRQAARADPDVRRRAFVARRRRAGAVARRRARGGR